LRWHLIERLGADRSRLRAGPREVTSAAKAILSASKINLENVSVAVKVLEQLELDVRMTELERRLGIGKGSVEGGNPAIGGSAD